MFPESAQNDRDPSEVSGFFRHFSLIMRLSGTPERLNNYLKGKVLDVGCGCGYMVKHLQEKGVDAYGLDGDLARVAYARESVKFPDKIIHADARSMPFPPETFDLVTSTVLYDHQKTDKEPVYLPGFLIAERSYPLKTGGPNRDIAKDCHSIKNEIFRVMKAGGLYLVQDWIDGEADEFFSGFERMIDNPCFFALRKPTHPTLPTK